MATKGFGTTITFDSGFFAEITNIDWDGVERPAIDTTHMLTTDGFMTFVPSDLKNMGQLTVQMYFDPDETLPIEGAAETVTITFASGATIVCQGFLQSASVAVPHDEKMTATAVIKFSGEAVMTPA